MGRIILAFRIFLKTLWSGPVAGQVAELLTSSALPKINVGDKSPRAESAVPKAATPNSAPKKSEALILLAALQREARLIDLVQQPLEQFSDEQIGAAARNVLRDSAAVLARFFALQPVVSQAEGETVDVPAAYDPTQFQLVGNVPSHAPYRGAVIHAGWEASQFNLPAWTGAPSAARIIAPAEIEFK